MARLIFYHEDNYCQIELLPIDCLDFCLKEAGLITDFSEKHKADIGWTDMYMRKTEPKQLAEYKIKVPDFEAALNKSFKKFDEVFTGYGSSYRIKCTETFAFGDTEDMAIFYEANENHVEKIWFELYIITESSVESALKMFSILSQLGNFIIADWGWCFIKKLENIESLQSYLVKRLDVFSKLKITKHIYFSNLTKITSNGICFTYCGESHFLCFKSCTEYFNAKNSASTKCVAERKIDSKPPYIVFYSNKLILEVSFYRRRIFKWMSTNDVKSFYKLSKKINDLGYTTYDLS